MLVLGFLLSTTGAGLAVSGFADNDQAARRPVPAHAAHADATPPTPQAAPPAPAPPSEAVDDHGRARAAAVLPDTEETRRAPTPPRTGRRPARQVDVRRARSAGAELPFTGFAAIPVLLLGLGLLSGGLVMRRSSATTTDASLEGNPRARGGPGPPPGAAAPQRVVAARAPARRAG